MGWNLYTFIKNNKKQFLILFLSYIFFSLYLIINGNFDNKLLMNITCNKNDIIQVFFKDKNSNFNEQNSRIKYITENINTNLIFEIPSDTNAIRVDFGQQDDMDCKIFHINFFSGYKNINLMNPLIDGFHNTINVGNKINSFDSYDIITTSNDSFIQINYLFQDYKIITT